jgi:5,10-methylene-tetrahydrofolate dehydrogenase/methenyl tetrahydrofolate cyclohydrolase
MAPFVSAFILSISALSMTNSRLSEFQSSGKAMIIDGKATAATIQEELTAEVAQLHKTHGILPGLAVILVGKRVDSATYVRMKKKTAAAIGLHSLDVDLEETVTQDEVLQAVKDLNDDPKVHGILVQLPLPSHIDEAVVLKAIAVEKDADGFSAYNIGNLCLRGGDPPLAVPCTPAGCIELLQRYDVEISGKDCVVLGRSNIVGMPVAALLQSCNGTVTVCHSRTTDIEGKVKKADIVIAAIGKPEFVKGSWLKPGAVVIDVGINSKEDATRKRGYRLVGDVDYDECSAVASAITPVPGGVGPMTIAMLMKNTVNLARHSIGLDRMPLRNTIHRNLSHRDFISLNLEDKKE